MKYKGTYFDMWDTWYLNINDTIHGFHLKAHDGENWNVGHIYTKDLLHFSKMRDILQALPEEEYPDDCLGKYTGCAIEKDGKCYLYYTMRDACKSEKIGLAISENMEHFTEYKNNPVLVPDKEVFVVRKKGEKTDCRDMHVVYDEDSGKYFGYFAAMARSGNGEVGVVGVAESHDLINWSNQKIAYYPGFAGVVEVPNVFKCNGIWYMTLMTTTLYGAKGVVREKNLNSFIIVAKSDAPDKEFKCCDDNVFLGSSRINNGYAMRSVEYKGKMYAFCIDRSEYGSSISLPKEIRECGETVKPFYTDILKKLRTGRVWENIEFSLVPAAFAWKNVVAGKVDKCGDATEVVGFKNSLQAFKGIVESIKSIEIECDISGDFDEAGIVLYCSSEKIDENYECKAVWDDYVWTANYISFDKKNNRLILSKAMAETMCERQFDFARKDKLHVRIIAMEGQIEVYVDDILYISCSLPTKSHIAPGVFSYSGKALISDFKMYELEE